MVPRSFGSRPVRTLALAVLAAGCAGGSGGNGPPPAGAIALSPDNSQLYVADTDNDRVIVVNAATQAVEQAITVGHRPERIQVLPDGRLFVSNRQDRSVSLVDPASGTEVTRIAVGTEPLGMALSNDGRSLAVVNHTNDSISIIDVPSLTVRNAIDLDALSVPAWSTIATRGPPVGVAFSGTRLYVTHDRTGFVSVVDSSSGNDLNGGPISLTLSPSQTGSQSRLPGQPTDPIVVDGILYFGQIHSTLTPIPTTIGVATNSYAGGSTPGSVAVVASGIATIDTTTNIVQPGQGLQVFTNPSPGQSFAPVPPVIMTSIGGQAMAGPSSVAIEPSGRFMYVPNMNSANVSILATDGALPPAADVNAQTSNGVLDLVTVGHGPKGIAIPATGESAFVYNALDETISVLENSGGVIQATSTIDLYGSSSPIKPASVAPTAAEAAGRLLFFSADDARMSNAQAGGIACASCHPNGRQDGRTWIFTEGPRNTPTLAGRQLATTQPYHWDGLLATPQAFVEIIQDRMGGTGALSPTDYDNLFAYLNGLEPPDNPHLNKDGTPLAANAASVARGQAIFNGMGACASCHAPSNAFQDNSFHNVGTESASVDSLVGTVSQTFPMEVNTPPLLGLFYSAPYLHDGSAATLMDRLDMNTTGPFAHGVTAGLSQTQKQDLVNYLNTL